MSSSGTGEHRPQRPAPAEQHLGDRLAAFVDGELTDDSRDRVLAHLATCPQCKTAAAEQRQLKSVVAASELPAISAGLLARLQGLPGMGPNDDFRDRGPWDPGGPGGPATPDTVDGPGEPRPGPFDGGLLGSGTLGSSRSGALGSGWREFSYLGPARDLLAPAGSRSRGFRIHQPAAPATSAAPELPDVVPQQSGSGTTAASRSRRFAFAAAGAFSLAAIAIGGALPMEAAVDGGARPDDGPAVSPLSANSVSDTHAAAPRDLLEEKEGLPPAVAASATSVALTRPMLAAGTVLSGAGTDTAPRATPAPPVSAHP
ncbi:MAG: hypothetical protein QOF98_2671 [Streptomyces sp.]|nr:hypothetical protein [Streptomyces sp.]